MLASDDFELTLVFHVKGLGTVSEVPELAANLAVEVDHGHVGHRPDPERAAVDSENTSRSDREQLDHAAEIGPAGMHEAVVSQLSQLSSLRVVSRTTMMGYAGTTKSIPQIAQELAVDGVVEGSVLRAGDEVRITVQLIHGPSDTHLWSKSYERDFADVIALQREVAQAIAQEIVPRLKGG